MVGLSTDMVKLCCGGSVESENVEVQRNRRIRSRRRRAVTCRAHRSCMCTSNARGALGGAGGLGWAVQLTDTRTAETQAS